MASESAETFNVVDVHDFKTVCRLCLSDQGPLLPLRELDHQKLPSVSKPKTVGRVDKILYSVSIVVEDQDELPSHICQTCDTLVSDYYTFKETCLVVDVKIHSLLKRQKELQASKRSCKNVESFQHPNYLSAEKECNLPETQDRSSHETNYGEKCCNGSSRKSKLPEPNVMPTATSYEFVSSNPLNFSLVEVLSTDVHPTNISSVICTPDISDQIDNTVEDDEQSMLDPLALKVEDLSSIAAINILCNNNSKDGHSIPDVQFSKDVKREPLVREFEPELPEISRPFSKEVSKEIQTSLPHEPVILGCEINLDFKTRKEDVTLRDLFTHQHLHFNTDKSLKSDNTYKLRPCNTKLLLSMPPEPKDKKRDSSNFVRARSPLCDSTRIVPKLKSNVSSRSKRGSSRPQTQVPWQYSARNTKALSAASNSEVEIINNELANSLSDDTSVPVESSLDEKDDQWCLIEPQVQVCVECGQLCSSYKSLVKHIRTHDAVRIVAKVVNCNFCEKKFRSQVLLDSHIYMRHKIKSDRHFLCHICGLVVDERRNFTHHMNKHFSKKDYLCDLCGAGYYNRFSLSHHIKRKHLEEGMPKLKCSVCEAEVSTPETMRRHMLLHTTGPTLKCPLCPKMFSRKAQVSRHMRSHTGETPYVCEVCKRGFTIKWNHTQHMRLHTKDKPYICDVCGKAFTHNVSKRSHMKRHVNIPPVSQETAQEDNTKFRRNETK